MIPTKRNDAGPSGGRGEDKPRGGKGQGGQGGQVEPKEEGETEGSEEIGGEKKEDRDELA